jgi:hypothetical protein
MATANLANPSNSVDTSKDSIVIVDNFQSIRGGRTLDVTGYGPILAGVIATLGAITPGSAYTNGTYLDVPLTGGAGAGATADIVVAGGVVTSVTLKGGGSGYAAGNSLSATAASIGGTGTGFAVAVATIKAATAEDVIRAGHIIIKDSVSGDHKPMPILGGSQYGALPANHSYAGVSINTCLVTKPFVGIMVRGTVNPTAMYFPIPAALLTAVKAAVPGIDFRAD